MKISHKPAGGAGIFSSAARNSAGKGAAFYDFHRRAMAGARLTVAFMGGSLTWGAGASDPQRTSYRALISRRLEQAYPKAHFTFVDAAIGGSGAQLGAFRLQRDVLAYQPDLFFLDFTLNDNTYQTSPDTLAAYESIMHRVITAGCPVVQMILASRFDIEQGLLEKMVRRTAHLALARVYHTVVGDAITLMRRHCRGQKAKLDVLWPPERFDNTHPANAGYALYAQAAWQALQKAIAAKMVCRVPARMCHGDRYQSIRRVPVATLAPLPPGWHLAQPYTASVAFDFMMSRWLDSLTVAANFVAEDRVKTRPSPPAQPLRVGFHGSTVLVFGESTPRSGKYRIVVDGRPGPEFDAGKMGRGGGNAHLWQVLAEGLPVGEHSLEIQPIFEPSGIPAEVRLESICVAGGQAKVWRL
jgi:lysophospholipase L1-like esterase